MNDEPANWQRWRDAAARPAVDEAIAALYQRLDEEIARREPTCWLSGCCCHFNSYGHRLYVTGLEIAWMWPRLSDDARRKIATLAHADALTTLDGCPLQSGKLCGVHAIRPLGCRIFFCDPAAQDWQSEVYEGYLDDLRTLHDRHELPYHYMEWRTGLGEAAEELSSFIQPR